MQSRIFADGDGDEPVSPRVRLHVERLEDRLFMNGDDPVAAAETLASDQSFDDVNSTGIDASVSQGVTDTTAGFQKWFESAAGFEDWLIELAIAEYGNLFGQPTYDYGISNGWYRGEVVVMGQLLDMRPIAAVTNDAASQHSSTNVQVEGVDEADLVETDGEYLYIISGRDLVIVKAGVGDELHVFSRVRLDRQPTGMYLSGDRLALVSSSQPEWQPWEAGIFGAPNEWHYEPPTTTVTVLDITDRATPTQVQSTEMDGRLVTSRVVDGQLRLVLTNEIRLPQPIAKPIYTAREAEVAPSDPSSLNPEATLGFTVWPSRWYGYAGVVSVYESQAEYLERVRDEFLHKLRPQFRTLANDGSVTSQSALVEDKEIHRPSSRVDRHMTTVATFDLASDESGPVDSTTLMTGAARQVYSTADSIYVFSQRAWDWRDLDGKRTFETDVWKFAINNQTHAIKLAAKGQFEGTLLNQFAADEHEGFLRIVTAPAGWGSGGHGVQVLKHNGHRLDVVGSVGDIAPNEVLYSVRFMGDRAFFVTFQKVDPLFAVDLSDPRNPTLMGELHIPGYSDYLQPIDENHLLAIGRGADESSGLFQELQVSIFDISDLTDPRLLHRYSFEGGRSTATPAAGNRWTRGDGDHHSVSYFAEQQILAIPIYSADAFGGFWGQTDTAPLFEPGHGGLQVFRIDVGLGFAPIGLIEHDTLIERSVRIGDRLFAISSDTVSVHELTDPSVHLGEVHVAADPSESPTGPANYVPPLIRAVAEIPSVMPVIDIPRVVVAPIGGGEVALPLPVETLDPPIAVNEEIVIEPGIDTGRAKLLVLNAIDQIVIESRPATRLHALNAATRQHLAFNAEAESEANTVFQNYLHPIDALSGHGDISTTSPWDSSVDHFMDEFGWLPRGRRMIARVGT